MAVAELITSTVAPAMIISMAPATLITSMVVLEPIQSVAGVKTT